MLWTCDRSTRFISGFHYERDRITTTTVQSENGARRKEVTSGSQGRRKNFELAFYCSRYFKIVYENYSIANVIQCRARQSRPLRSRLPFVLVKA